MSDNKISFESTEIGAAPEGRKRRFKMDRREGWVGTGRGTFPLLLKNDTNIKDGFVKVWFKAVVGSQDRAGGVVWHALN